MPSATSTGYVPGVYKWQAYVTNGSDRVTVSDGEMTVKPNFATATTLDTRPQAKQMLDAVDAAIMALTTDGTSEYTINGRSMKKVDVPQLIALRDKYGAIYLSEQNADRLANGLAAKNRIMVRI